MKRKINLEKDNLVDSLQGILLSFSRSLQEEINEATKETAKEAVNKLRATSPKKTGNYAKGWTKTTSTKNDERGFKVSKIVIYNKNKPTLTHLLENGHATRNGKRVSGKPHIGPVAQEIEEKYYQNIIKTIENHKEKDY